MNFELYICQETKNIGYSLISELNIKNGSELSGFLNVNTCYNNHEAFLIWLDKLLKERKNRINKHEIKQKLFESIPSSMSDY